MVLKIFEMFSGYGGASFALKKAGIDFRCVGYSEVDKFAVQCYSQNHLNKDSHAWCWPYGDCTKIDAEKLPDFDLLTGGFPCQSFSVAGKGLGEQDTRGTLFHDIIRIAEAKKPKYMLLENVKGLTFKNHKKTFDKILSELRRIGYTVHWKVLNSKDYGIPQNRERVFFVCVRYHGEPFMWPWPKKEPLELFLKDILEPEVDEKYYLKPEKVAMLLKNVDEKKLWNCNPSGKGMGGNVNTKNISNTISINKGEGPKICIPVITPDRLNKRQNGRRFKTDGEPSFTVNTQDRHGILQMNNPKHSNDRVYSNKGISPCLNTMQGGNRQPFIQVKNATEKGYLEAKEGDGVALEHPNSKTRRGRVQDQMSATLQCNDSKGVVTQDLTIRKLTPKECFRLMGFLNDEINVEGISNSQQYKLAGNGWDINLVSKIFERMFQ